MRNDPPLLAAMRAKEPNARTPTILARLEAIRSALQWGHGHVVLPDGRRVRDLTDEQRGDMLQAVKEATEFLERSYH
jgi:hypothetical protein